MVSFLVKIIFKLYRSDYEDCFPGYYFGCVDHVPWDQLIFLPNAPRTRRLMFPLTKVSHFKSLSHESLSLLLLLVGLVMTIGLSI